VKEAVVKRIANPVDKHVGSRIRMRRLMLGMSQEKLGNGLGLTFNRCRNMRKERTASARAACSTSRSFCRSHCRSFSKAHRTCRGAQWNWTGAFTGLRFQFPRHHRRARTHQAFMQIKQANLRRRIVHLVEEIAGDDLS